LFRAEVGDSGGLDPLVGHVVVFFFVSLSALGLTTRWFSAWRGIGIAVGAMATVAVVSEALQPVLTLRRRAELADLGANAVGITGAVVLTGLLIAVLGHSSRRSWATAALCVVGLVASAAVTAFGVDSVEYALGCRGVGYEPIDSSPGAPVIQVIDGEVRLGDASPVPLGDGEISADSADLRCSVLDGNAYTIVATVVPESIRTNGPARIFTSSGGTQFNQFNTHIGQDFHQLSIRVRSGRGRSSELVPGVFAAGRRVTVALVVADGWAEVFVDGERRAVVELRGTSLARWDSSFPILVGDESTRDRAFNGDIEELSVYDRALIEGDPALG
jgi:hypothetical protein